MKRSTNLAKQKDLETFKYAFSHLRRAPGRSTRGREAAKAPHKPIMLLAMIDFASDQNGKFDGFIPLEAEIVARFTSLWEKYETPGFKCEPALPFFHLKRENLNYWHILPQPGAEESLK